MTQVQQVDFAVDTLQAILWQYNDATRLQSLLTDKQAWYNTNQAGFWSDWLTDVFDMQTANDFGLAVWAIILDLPITVDLPPSPTNYPAWGFDPFGMTFDNGNFGTDDTQNVRLTTGQKRLALRLRYFQLTTDGTVYAINRFIGDLFASSGTCYVQVTGPMQYRYVFNFNMATELQFVLSRFDLLPRPAAVGVEWFINTGEQFGFEPYGSNFDNSNFGY